MKVFFEKRCEKLARIMLDDQSTVRAVAKKTGISKSTVHKDITVELKKVNPTCYYEIKKLLEKNKDERHLRGGEATRIKYMNKS